MASAEMNQIPFAGKNIERCACGIFHDDFLSGAVLDAGCSCDHIQFREHTVLQGDKDIRESVFQCDFKRLRLFIRSIYGRKAFQGVFSLQDAVAVITHVSHECSVICSNAQGRCAEITGSFTWIFQWNGIGGYVSASAGIMRVGGESVVAVNDTDRRIAADFRTVVCVKKESVRTDLHLVAGVLCVEGDC